MSAEKAEGGWGRVPVYSDSNFVKPRASLEPHPPPRIKQRMVRSPGRCPGLLKIEPFRLAFNYDEWAERGFGDLKASALATMGNVLRYSPTRRSALRTWTSRTQ